LNERGSFQNEGNVGLFLVGESVVSDFNFNSSELNGVEDCVEESKQATSNNNQVGVCQIEK
jgi:predicted cupin superfamily sugar epimerase